MLKGSDTAIGPNEIFLPLSQAINPELIDGLKKIFRVHDGAFIGGGEYQQAPGEEIVNLGDLPPEEFMEWANRATGTMRNIAHEFAKRERTVTIGEGARAGEDPRLRRIREQIAASKKFRSG